MGLPQPTTVSKDDLDAKMLEHEGQLTKQVIELARAVAKRESISIAGITILGGKPYINVTGLDTKIKNKEKESGWVKAGEISEELEMPSEENQQRAKFKVTIKMFDKTGFELSIKMLKPKDKDIVDLLTKIYTYVFDGYGSASPASLKMSTMKNADNITMMAERRASNRAKRAVTGTGLTSVEEIGVETEIKPSDATTPQIISDEPEPEEPEPEGPQESPKEKPTEKQPEVHKVLLSQIRNKVIGTKNLGQAEMLVPKDLKEMDMVKLVNFLAGCKEMEPDEWHRERDKILGGSKQ